MHENVDENVDVNLGQNMSMENRDFCLVFQKNFYEIENNSAIITTALFPAGLR